MSRHVLVTGANRGIGLEFVRQLLARGDRVVAACRHPGKATALNALAGEFPGRLHALPLNVTDAKSRAELVRELPLVCESLQERPFDLLINNAGVLHSGERFGHLSEAHLEDSFRVNASGPLLLTEALAPHLADGATVANLSSMLGSIANTQRFGTPSYNISKAAQNMATRLLAHALSDRRIVVVALHPGWVQTDMGGDGAQIAPKDSVAGLLRTIDALTPAQSGGFFDWNGATMAW
ncbi:MAG: SDR family oxidoreductase [Lysobacter sp.]|nr:SDR family oxidoreductase [Lysobacter sp.]